MCSGLNILSILKWFVIYKKVMRILEEKNKIIP